MVTVLSRFVGPEAMGGFSSVSLRFLVRDKCMNRRFHLR